MKKVISLFLTLFIIFGITACSTDNDTVEKDGNFYDEFPTGDEIVTVVLEKNPVATIEMTNGKKIVIELCYDSAPNTVASFIAYANADAYKGFGFTEVRNSEIVMADLIEGEYSAPFYTMDEYENNSLSHLRGTVTMNRSSESDKVTGRFSIITTDKRYFDKYCTAFGRVIEGMEYVDELAAIEVNTEDYLYETPVEIKSITVDTFGQDIPDPVIIRKD